MLTVDEVVKVVPANVKNNISQTMIDQINNAVSDPIMAEEIQRNFLSYTGVLKDGKFKIQDYMNAVMFVSYKLMNNSNQEAWIKTFPKRYQELVARNTDNKTIAAYVAMYNKGKLVNAILEQTLVPVWVYNQHNYQKAINVQMELMTTSQSDMVRTTAANSILTHLTKPKEAANTISIDIKESSGMTELKGMLTQVAREQRAAIEAGATAKTIAAQKIIDVESEPSEPC